MKIATYPTSRYIMPNRKQAPGIQQGTQNSGKWQYFTVTLMNITMDNMNFEFQSYSDIVIITTMMTTCTCTINAWILYSMCMASMGFYCIDHDRSLNILDD